MSCRKRRCAGRASDSSPPMIHAICRRKANLLCNLALLSAALLKRPSTESCDVQWSNRFLVFDDVQFCFQFHRVLFGRAALDGQRSPAGEVTMTDLTHAPGETTPHHPVVINLYG